MLFHIQFKIFAELLNYTISENKSISEIVYENEISMRPEAEVHSELMRIWNTMLECMYIGCHSEGILPGGLHVRRRAFDMHQNLIGLSNYNDHKVGCKKLEKPRLNFVKS